MGAAPEWMPTAGGQGGSVVFDRVDSLIEIVRRIYVLKSEVSRLRTPFLSYGRYPGR